jgi:hypothetical protein
MPTLIRIKRGDTENLNNHILADGEPAYTRYVTFDEGPQRGETIPDYYFRIGDGETFGGIIPGADSIGAGLQYIMAMLGVCMRTLADLTGAADSHWVPWIMKDMVPSYAEGYHDSIPRRCLTPDFHRYGIRDIHLGNESGHLFFDGTNIDFVVSSGKIKQQIKTYNDRTLLENRGVLSNSMIVYNDFTAINDFAYGEEKIASCIRFFPIYNPNSTATSVHLVGALSTPLNCRSDKRPNATGYSADIKSSADEYYTEVGPLKNFTGYKVTKIDYGNSWYDITENKDGQYVEEYCGLSVGATYNDTTSRCPNNAYAIRIDDLYGSEGSYAIFQHRGQNPPERPLSIRLKLPTSEPSEIYEWYVDGSGFVKVKMT